MLLSFRKVTAALSAEASNFNILYCSSHTKALDLNWMYGNIHKRRIVVLGLLKRSLGQINRTFLFCCKCLILRRQQEPTQEIKQKNTFQAPEL